MLDAIKHTLDVLREWKRRNCKPLERVEHALHGTYFALVVVFAAGPYAYVAGALALVIVADTILDQ